LIIAGSTWTGNGAPLTFTINDTRGTNYTVKTSAQNPTVTLFIAYGIAPSSGANTVTVDPVGTGVYISFSIDEFSGVSATPLDLDGSIVTGTGTTATRTLTTINSNALIVGLLTHDVAGVQTMTPGTGFTQIGEEEDNGNYQAHNAEFRIVTTAQSYTVDWATFSGSRTWGIHAVSFKPNSGSAGPPSGGGGSP
jgi:hypothetical protein